MWTGKESGKRAIVGGYSPHVSHLPKSFLDTGFVIGINRWPADFPCNYWIGLDTGVNWQKYYLDEKPEYADQPKFLRTLECPKFMREPNIHTERFVPKDAGIFFKSAHRDEIPTKWNHSLRWGSSTAMAAISLAIVLGASEVVLYGVDFVGIDRADGTKYHRENFWDEHQEPINNLLKQFQELVPVYKLHPDSWLDCPLMEVI